MSSGCSSGTGGGAGHGDMEPWKGTRFGEEDDEISVGRLVSSWVCGFRAQCVGHWHLNDKGGSGCG